MNYLRTEYRVLVLHKPKLSKVAKGLEGLVKPYHYFTIRVFEVNKPWNTMKMLVLMPVDSLLYDALDELIINKKCPCFVKPKLPGRILSKRYNVFLFSNECNEEDADIKMKITKQRYQKK